MPDRLSRPILPSSPEVRNGADHKDDVALADALLGDCSPPCEPTSPPTPVKENAKKQKPPAGIAKSTPKLSPELMRLVLNALAECPFLCHAANKAGIHRKTLAYWIRRSEAGDDGYDIKWQGITVEISRTLQISDLGGRSKTPRQHVREGTFWLRQSSNPSRPCDVQDRPGSCGPRF